jgi:DNA-binding CsgD family transcriptional regulator
VRSDGSLGGCGFGVGRKASLIQREEENLKRVKAGKTNED